MERTVSSNSLMKINPSLVQRNCGHKLDIQEYIDHVENGVPLRKIARRDGVHPSTVLRRVRKIEARRDDPFWTMC